MGKHLRAIMRSVALVTLLVAVFGLAGLTRTAAAAQTTDPVAVVRSFIDAFSRGDIDTMRSLVDPAVRFVFEDPVSPTDESLDEFAAPPRETVVLNSITQTAPDTVVAAVTISGADVPALPFPVILDTTWTVRDGKITREVSRFSAETLRNLEALGPPPGTGPGMPRTGQGGSPITPALSVLALGLLCVTAGVLARRGRARVR